MQDGYFSDFQEEENLLDYFDEMLRMNSNYPFDSEELEDIIDVCLSRFDTVRSKTAIQLALRLYPDDEVFQIKKAKYLLLVQKIEEAEAILDDYPYLANDAEVMIMRAHIAAEKDDHEEAIKILELVVASDSDYKEDAYYPLAYQYEELKEYRKAVKCYKKILEFDPDDEQAMENISINYEMLHEPEEGIKFFKKFVQKHPYNAGGWYSLGNIYSTISDYDNSIDAYDYALAADENYLDAYVDKGQDLKLMGKYREAIAAYEEALSLGCPPEDLYCDLAECYYELEEHRKALSYYKKALDQKTEPPGELYLSISMCLLKMNQIALAEQFVDHALERFPDNPEYWMMKAEVEHSKGNLEAALDIYRNTEERAAEYPEYWLVYAETLVEMNNLDAACDILRTGIQKHTDNAELSYRTAALLAKKGAMQEASTHFANALALDPKGYQIAFDYYPAMQTMPLFLDMVMDGKQ